MRVLMVEDQRAFLESMAVVIDAQADLECVAIARNAADGLDAAKRHRPDVVLMDVGLPDGDGIDVAGRLLADLPATRVIILTGRPDATVLARAAAAGASAFLLKNSSIEEILDAIRTNEGRRLQIDPDALISILDATPASVPPGARTHPTRTRGARGTRARPSAQTDRTASRHHPAHLPGVREDAVPEARCAQRPRGGGARPPVRDHQPTRPGRTGSLPPRLTTSIRGCRSPHREVRAPHRLPYRSAWAGRRLLIDAPLGPSHRRIA